MNLDEYINGLDKIIIDRIKEVRTEKKISRKKLANDLGIAVSTYGDLERGRINFDLKRLIAVLKYLEIDDFFKKEESKSQLEVIEEFSSSLKNFSTQSNDAKETKEEVQEMKLDLKLIKMALSDIVDKLNKTEDKE